MNKDEHMIIGLFIGLLGGIFSSGYTEYFNFIMYNLYVGLTVFVLVFPNLIETRKGKNNRKFFHSYLVFGLSIILILWLNLGDQTLHTYLSTSVIIAYVSHPLLDATSKVGIPKY
ncbi:MAG: hypothetical protein ACW98F_06185 [Candidatus Hodarchaeales archaeon]